MLRAILTCYFLCYFVTLQDNEFEQKMTQNGYIVEKGRLVMTSYNKKIISYARIVNYKFNRTQECFNMTLTMEKTLPEIYVTFQMFKFLDNVYKDVAIRGKASLCNILKSGNYGISIIKKNGNYTDCPWTAQNTYSSTKVVIDAGHWPKYMPSGQYKISMNFRDENMVSALIADYYFVIKYPLKRGWK